MKIVYENFKGTLPQATPLRLPQNYAQTALNCNFERGMIEPSNYNTLTGTVQKATPAFIFKCGAKWESWASVVDVVRSWIYDSTSDRFYYTDGAQPKQMRESGINDTLSSAVASTTYNLGISGPAGTPTTAKTDDGSPGTTIEAVVQYVFTYVTDWGEESVPSPASDVLTVYTDEYVTITCPTPTAERAAATNITKIRVYRLAATSTGQEYQYLGEETIAAVTEDHIDRDGSDYAITPDAELGAVLATDDYDPLPATAQGLLSFSNGLMAAFVSNQVYLNEPFIAYAFPEEYIKLVESDVVGLGHHGATLVVMTNTHPYVAVGTDPEGMILDRLTNGEKCVAKRSIVSTPYGVLHATPNGLMLVTGAGETQMLTDGIYTKEQWSNLSPENFIGFWYNKMYYAFEINANTGYAFDLFTDMPYVRTFTLENYPVGNALQFLDGYVDPASKVLYILALSADTNYYVFGFEQDIASYGKLYTWKSRKEHLETPTNFGAGLLLGTNETDVYLIDESGNRLVTEASEDLLAAEAGEDAATLKTYAGETLKQTRSITNDSPFRLPGGFTDREWEFEISNTTIQTIKLVIATTMDELWEPNQP